MTYHAKWFENSHTDEYFLLKQVNIRRELDLRHHRFKKAQQGEGVVKVLAFIIKRLLICVRISCLVTRLVLKK